MITLGQLLGHGYLPSFGVLYVPRCAGFITLATAVVLGRFGSSRPWVARPRARSSGAYRRPETQEDRNADVQGHQRDARSRGTGAS